MESPSLRERLTAGEADSAEGRRWQLRAVADRRAMRAVLHELDPLAPEPDSAATGSGSTEAEVPWMRACAAIGAALGVAMKPYRHRLRGIPPVAAIAQASGVRYRGVSLSGPWWKRSGEPLLAFRRDGDLPVAVLPRRRGKGYYWHTRAGEGLPAAVGPDAAAALKSLAFMFYRTLPRRALSVGDLLRFVCHDRWREWGTILATCLAVALLALALPIATRALLDSVLPGEHRPDLIWMGSLLVVAAVASGLITVTRGCAALRLEGRLSLAFDAALWDRLVSLPLPFFRQYTAGDLAQRGLAAKKMCAQLTRAVLESSGAAIVAMTSLALLVYYSAPLAALAVLMASCGLAAMLIGGVRRLGPQRDIGARSGAIAGLLSQLVAGIGKFRVAGAEGRAFVLWAREFAAYRSADLKARRTGAGLEVFNSVYPAVCTTVLLVVHAVMTERLLAGLTPGELIAFVIAFGQFWSGVLAFGTAVVGAASVGPLYERATPILQAVPEASVEGAAAVDLTGDIAVSDLSFRYRADAPLVLRDVSFCVRHGEYVALVGPSGSGKSTLFRLLLGFDRPAAGSISYDGVALSDLESQTIRRQIGTVLQSGTLLPGTIRDNICGMARLSMADVWEAARLVGLDGDIRAMPMGMHTIVAASGAGLSGGQRQRLLIARAVARRPRLLLFDEPTSALDNRTQAAISRELEALKATRLVIAHRLTTILGADRILVMSQGRLVQSGTYGELVAEPGVFRQLAERQLLSSSPFIASSPSLRQVQGEHRC